MNISGYAHFNGITLCNDTKMVSVFSNKKTITKNIKCKTVNIGVVNNIIFIRQIRRIILNPVLGLTCIILLTLQTIDNFVYMIEPSHSMLYLIPLMIIIIYAIRMRTNLFRYHAAEHMVVSCIESGKGLNLKNVRAQSLVHIRCGSILVIFIYLLWLLSECSSYEYILKIGSIFVALEILQIIDTYKSLNWIKDILLWVQHHTVIQEPTDDQLELAIKCAKILCERHTIK